MFKNTASQKILFYAHDTTTDTPKTGDAANLTAYYCIDGGSVVALTDTSASELSNTNAKGWYSFDLTQAETNGNLILFTCASTTANVYIESQLITTADVNVISINGTAIVAGGTVSADIVSINGGLVSVPSIIDTNVIQVGGESVSVAGIIDTNLVEVNGEAIAMADALNANVVSVASQTATAAAPVTFPASIADNADLTSVKTKTDFLPAATAGAAGGVFIAGSNAATTVNITGNLSGSVGSVTAGVNVTQIDSVAVTPASVFDANIVSVDSSSVTLGTQFQADVVSVSGTPVSLSSEIDANITKISGQTATAVSGVTFPSTISAPGDKMDLVDAPSATAVASIKGNLGTLDANLVKIGGSTPSLITSVDANLTTIKGNDFDVASEFLADLTKISGQTVTAASGVTFGATVAASGDKMDLVDSPSATAVASIKGNLGTLDANLLTVQGIAPSVLNSVDANIISVGGSAVTISTEFTSDVVSIDGQAVTASSPITVPASIASETTVSGIKTKTDYLPAATAGSAGGVAILGSKMDLVDSPNATAISAIKTGLGTVNSNLLSVNNIPIESSNSFDANLVSINSLPVSTPAVIPANIEQIAGQNVTASSPVVVPASIASQTDLASVKGTVEGLPSSSTIAGAILANSANKLVTDNSGFVTYSNAAPPSASTIGDDAASKILAVPANKISTNASGQVVYSNTAPPTVETIVSNILTSAIDGSVDLQTTLKRLLSTIVNNCEVTTDGSGNKILAYKDSAGTSTVLTETIAVDGSGRTKS